MKRLNAPALLCLLLLALPLSTAQAQPAPQRPSAGRLVQPIDGLPLRGAPRRGGRAGVAVVAAVTSRARGQAQCRCQAVHALREVPAPAGRQREGAADLLKDLTRGPRPPLARLGVKEVRTRIAVDYPPALDGHYLDTRAILRSRQSSFFALRGWQDAESPNAIRYATYVWDVAAHQQDPDVILDLEEREWRGYRVADGRIPYFYFTGHCFDAEGTTPDGAVKMIATHTAGKDAVWMPDELDRLVRFAVNVSPPGVRPRIIFGGCGMAYGANQEFLRWLSRRPGLPIVVASEARCHTTFWGWPSMTNVLIFSDGRRSRLGASGLPGDLREW